MHVEAVGSQTAAEAGRIFAFTGRLKPPSSTVVRAFFRKLFSCAAQGQNGSGFKANSHPPQK